MNKPEWIFYHSRVEYTRRIDRHFLFLVNVENFEILEFGYTDIPNFELVITMIDKRLELGVIPRAIYVTKDWLKELKLHFRVPYFKNINSLSKDVKEALDAQYKEEIIDFIKQSFTGIKIEEHFETGGQQ